MIPDWFQKNGLTLTNNNSVIFASNVPAICSIVPANMKTWNGVPVADIKTINGVAIASVKSVNGIT